MSKKDKDLKNKKPKKGLFNLSNLLHLVKKLKLKADVVIDGERYSDYEIGWVKVYGSQDPTYVSRASDYLMEYRSAIQEASEEDDDEERERLTKEATKRFTSVSVACSIESWDKSFFERDFDLDYAIELFQDKKWFLIYNQIASYTQDAESFLPNASQPR